MDEPSVSNASPDETKWTWSGNIKDEEQRLEYRAFITISSTDEQLDVHLSDGNKSLTGMATKASLSDDTSSGHATVDADRHMDIIKQSLESHRMDPKNARLVRIVCRQTDTTQRTPTEYAVCIAAPWGTEFGLSDLYVDVATIKLQHTPVAQSFLDVVFRRMHKSRAILAQFRSRAKALDIEIEDLCNAQDCLKEFLSDGSRKKRMQIFADTINAYKLKCAEGKDH